MTRLLFALLLFSISCFALTPPEVVLVVNSASTLDTDGNSRADWRDVVLWYAAVHTDWDTAQVCSVRTYDDQDDMPWDFISNEIDTSDDYGQSVEVAKNINHDYILDDLCATFTARGWWGQKKCAVLVMGLWLRTQHNGTWTATCGSSPAASIIWSLDDIVRVFARPAFAWNSAWNIDGLWTNAYRAATNGGTLREFVPGKYANYSIQDGNDSLAQWLLVSRLDGLHVDDVRGMITRAASATPLTWDGATTWTANGWAVIDQDSTVANDSAWFTPYSSGYTNEWGNPNRLRADLVSAFGDDQILYDSTRGTTGANPDTITAHMGSGSEQVPGGNVLFYYNNSRHSNPQLTRMHYYNLTMSIANGALVMDAGSFNCTALHDTTLRGDGQPLLVEAIRAGFTYAAGQVCEPTTGYYVSPRYAGQAFVGKYASIAQVGQICAKGLKLCVVLGDPLGCMGRSTVTAVAGSQTTGGGGWSSWR